MGDGEQLYSDSLVAWALRVRVPSSRTVGPDKVRRVLATLVRFDDGAGTAWPSAGRIARELSSTTERFHDRDVRAALALLEEWALISPSEPKRQGRQTRWHFAGGSREVERIRTEPVTFAGPSREGDEADAAGFAGDFAGDFAGTSHDEVEAEVVDPRVGVSASPVPAGAAATIRPLLARCTTHAGVASPPPCRGCAAAREAAERAVEAAQRDARVRRAAEARERRAAIARAARIAIDRCCLCDADGRARNGMPCDHDPTAADRASRGVEAVRAAMRRIPEVVAS